MATNPNFNVKELMSTTESTSLAPSVQTVPNVLKILDLQFDPEAVFKYLSPNGRKLPPTRRLFLTGYDWIHSWSEFSSMWNLSALLGLSLASMRMPEFFTAVLVHECSRLVDLTIADPVFSETSRDQSMIQFRLIIAKILPTMKQLRSLELLCDHWSVIGLFDVFIGVLPQIRRLVLDTCENFKPMDADHLDHILRRSPNLKESSIEFDGELPDVSRIFT